MKKRILSLLIASLFMVSSCGGSNNGNNNPGTNDPSNPSTPSEGGQEVDPEDPGDPVNPGDDPVDPGDDPVDPGDDPVDPEELEGNKYTFASGSFKPIEGQEGPSEDLINSQYEGVFMNVYPDTKKEGEGYMQLFYPMVYGEGESGSGSDTRGTELNYAIYNCTYTLNEGVYEATILFINVAGQSMYSPYEQVEMSFTISNESLILRVTIPTGTYILNFVDAGEADPYLNLEAPKELDDDADYEGYDKYEFYDFEMEAGYEDYKEMFSEKFDKSEFYYNEKTKEFIQVSYNSDAGYEARTRYFGTVVFNDVTKTYWLHCDKIDVYVSGMYQELEQDMNLSPVVIGEGTVTLMISSGYYDEESQTYISFTVTATYKLVSE